MKISHDDYTIEILPEKAVLSGKEIRLQSVMAYEKLFEPIFRALEMTPEGYGLDLQNLEFLNSSGVTAIARIILEARKQGKLLTMEIKGTNPWQKKTIVSLEKLYNKVKIVTL